MGARVAKRRAASRAAKKRKPTTKSQATTEGTTSRETSHVTSAPVDEEQAAASACQEVQVTEEQPGMTSSLKGRSRKTVPGQEKAPTQAIRATEGTKKDPPSKVKAVEQDMAETVPDSDIVLPERRARARFTTLLANITEEAEVLEADRSIGNYQFEDEEWDLWRAGPVERDDEFEEDDSDESDDSDGTKRTAGRAASKPPSHVGAPSKPNPKKSKVAGKSKRKREDPDSDSADSDSEQRESGECLCMEAQCMLICWWTDFTYQIDVSSKTRDTRKLFAASSETKWANLEDKIAGILNIFPANLRAQYVLSTEPAGAIPIALTSQDDLAELHERLIPLVVPPRNANGSVSKRKMKEVTVKVTDKNDDVTSSASNGKVRRTRFLMTSNTY